MADPRDPLSSRERRTITIVVGDLKGYTAASEASDPEILADVVETFLDDVARLTARYGGRLAQTRGDGFLALFGTPVAREDDAKRAIACALRIQNLAADWQAEMESRLGRELPLRIGINTGPTVVHVPDSEDEEIPIAGDAVNVAARLESVADPGSVLVSETTRELAANSFAWGPGTSFSLKNRTRPVVAYEVLGQRRSVRVRPESFVSPFIGRKAELSELATAWASSRRGDPRTVVVEGPPGSGKSRMVHEFLERLADQDDEPKVAFMSASPGPSQPLDPMRRLVISCLDEVNVTSGAASTPDDILNPAVKALITSPGAVRPSRISRRGLREGLAEFFFDWMGGQPTVLVIEDGQWVDLSTLALTAELQRSPILSNARLLVVYLHRWSDRRLPKPLRKAVKITIEGLSDGEAEELVDWLIEDAGVGLDQTTKATILGRAEGNPLFVEEIFRMLDREEPKTSFQGPQQDEVIDRSENIPPTIEQIILARFDEIEPKSRALAQEASVIGKSFPDELLAAITDSPAGLATVLRRLENANMLRYWEGFAGDGHEFTHHLAWSTLYESLLIRRRERLHLKIAETIERMYPDSVPDYAPILASHYERGGNPELAAHFYLQASRQAEALHASTDAKTQRRTAARLVGLTSLWSMVLRRPAPSGTEKAVSFVLQSSVAVLMVMPILLFLMSQPPAGSARTFGVPLVFFDPSLAALVFPLMIGAVPVFLSATAIAQLRSPMYIQNRPSWRDLVRDALLTLLILLIALGIFAGLTLMAVRFGWFGPVLEAFVVSTAVRIVVDRAGVTLLVPVVLGALGIAVALVGWLVVKARGWRIYLEHRSAIDSDSKGTADRRIHAQLSVLSATAGLVNLILFLLFVGRLLPGASSQFDVTRTSALLLIGCVSAQFLAGIVLWLYARRVKDIAGLRRAAARAIGSVGHLAGGPRRPRSLGFEVPLAMSVVFGILLTLPMRENVLIAYGDVSAPSTLSEADDLVSLFPESAHLLGLRGITHLDGGEAGLTLAEDDLRRAIELDPTWHALYGMLADTQLAQNDIVGALATNDRLLELEPDHPHPYFQRAILTAEAEDWESFGINMEKAATVGGEGGTWDALVVRCQANNAIANPGVAIEACRSAGTQNPFLYDDGFFRALTLELHRRMDLEARAASDFEDAGVDGEEYGLILSTLAESDLPTQFSHVSLIHQETGALYWLPGNEELVGGHGVTEGYETHFINFDEFGNETSALAQIITGYETVAGAEKGYELHTDSEVFQQWRVQHMPSMYDEPPTVSISSREELPTGDTTERLEFEIAEADGTVRTESVVVSRQGRVVSMYAMGGDPGLAIDVAVAAGSARLAANFPFD